MKICDNTVTWLAALSLICLISPCAARSNGQENIKPASAGDPIKAILKAFENHPVVALGEGSHGNRQGATLRLMLLRDPGFIDTVDDILVEFGASRYQSIMDRYISGASVPREKLRLCWEETTQPFIWDAPIYEEFYAAVRSLNLSQDSERKIRVLLGEPEIDWSQFKTKEDLRAWYRDNMVERSWGKVNIRDGSAVDIILRESLDRGRKALVIYGDAHLRRDNLPLEEGFMTVYFKDNFVHQMEKIRPGSVFNITTFPTPDLLLEAWPDAALWPRCSLFALKKTPLGDLTIEKMGPNGLGRMFDALLWLGTSDMISFSKALPEALAEESYYKEMIRRDGLWIGQYQELLPRLRERYIGLSKQEKSPAKPTSPSVNSSAKR